MRVGGVCLDMSASRTIYLDGEPVDFQGSEPASLDLALELIEQHLADAERTIDSLVLDGQRTEVEVARQVEGDWSRLEIKSERISVKLISVMRSSIDEGKKLLDTIDTLSRKALSQPWRLTQTEVLAIFDVIGPVIERCGLLVNFGQIYQKPWQARCQESFEQCGRALEQLVVSVEGKDCAQLSEACALRLAPSLEELIKVIDSQALPEMESGAR